MLEVGGDIKVEERILSSGVVGFGKGSRWTNVGLLQLYAILADSRRHRFMLTHVIIFSSVAEREHFENVL